MIFIYSDYLVSIFLIAAYLSYLSSDSDSLSYRKNFYVPALVDVCTWVVYCLNDEICHYLCQWGVVLSASIEYIFDYLIQLVHLFILTILQICLDSLISQNKLYFNFNSLRTEKQIAIPKPNIQRE